MRLLILLALTSLALAEPSPKRSWFRLPTSNGLTAAVYNVKEDRVEAVFPHLFRDYGLDQPVKPWLEDLRWHAGTKPVRVGYLENTHVLAVDYPDLQVRLYAPFTGDHRRLVVSLSGVHRDVKITFRGGARMSQWNLPGERRIALTPPDRESTCPEGPAREVQRMREHYTRVPSYLNREERNLFEQSVAVLKMGQVSPQETPELARGQIVASLPPGCWNIGWLRDAIYSILALDRLGLYDEARAALTFFVRAKSGTYEHFVWKDGVDYGVKVPYLITVCRYFGPGVEESDFNEFGPNIELDGFGLFLVALTDYVERSGDRAFLDAHRGQFDRLVADAILTLIEGTGIIRAESGPWEMHLPGRHQAWTSIVNSAGLRAYGHLVGDERYTRGAERLKEGLLREFLVDGRFLKGFTEATGPAVYDFYDGGTIEAFTLQVLTDPQLFRSHYEEYVRALFLKGRGFARLNNPDWYTSGEWPFLSLRNAQALIACGRPAAAQILIDRVTAYAALNYNLIAELYGRTSDDYEGAVPMVGYGAAAYILAQLDRR